MSDDRQRAGGSHAPPPGPAASWRPMAFGDRAARTIADPLIEPLWEGRRVLVHVTAGGALNGAGDAIELRDEGGLLLAGHPDLRVALRLAMLAASMVADGYLVTVPRLDAAIAPASVGPEAPTLAAATRQIIAGSHFADRNPAARRPAQPGGRSSTFRGAGDAGSGLPGRTSEVTTTAFVAVDLLALDGEPLLEVPLLERKRLLDSVLQAGELVRRSPHVRPPAGNWYRQWRAYGFWSMAVKHANSRYYPGSRSDHWSIAAIPDR